jgi:undecaprenyl-diphosphatase
VVARSERAPGVVQLTYLQAIVIGLLQGVSELFPVSSLGHSVLFPAWVGGNWQSLVTQQSSSESPYLAFIVGLHCATAVALLLFFWRDWVGIIGGFFTSLRDRRVHTVYQRMAWLIVISTIPAGLIGLLFEHDLRVLFAKPEAAAVFLTINGLMLLAGEWLRRRAKVHPDAAAASDEPQTADPLDVSISRRVGVATAGIIGTMQAGALFAGISRSGATMVGGLVRGLSHEEAVRFSFLLATPVIFAAGVLKIPDLVGPLGNGIRGQVLAGSVAAFIGALVSARFLVRWFRTRTLTPFAIYCLVVGTVSIVHFG